MHITPFHHYLTQEHVGAGNFQEKMYVSLLSFPEHAKSLLEIPVNLFNKLEIFKKTHLQRFALANIMVLLYNFSTIPKPQVL